MHISFGIWDIALLVVVTIQATVLSYVHAPKWKAFVWSLPIPFTLASLALGRPIDATNVMGLNALLIYTHGVRLLHQRFRLPIVPVIIVCALAYCAIGWRLSRALSADDTTFWITAAGTFGLGVVLYLATPHKEEPGHRSPLPVWVKLPAIAIVILFLIIVKNSLHGFMTMFPMVGVVAAYEARESLWTIGRQVPVLMMTTVPLMATSRLLYGNIGLGPSLLVGWVVFACALAFFTRRMLAEAEKGLVE